MRTHNTESFELILITLGCAAATLIALIKGHQRFSLLITLTLLMAVMAFVARYRHRRRIRTLHGKGHRRRRQ